MRRLRQRHVLVTGAASGIGRQLVADLVSQHGAEVLAVDLDRAGLDALQAAHPTIRCFLCDLAHADAIIDLTAQLGPVDVLINNAGIFYAGDFETMSMADFERVLQVDLLAAVRLSHALLPRLLTSEVGCIVNMASAAGLSSPPGMCAYGAAKAGLIGFSEALRGELHGRVHVLEVCPTFVRTQIAKNALTSTPDGRETEVTRMDLLLERVGGSSARISTRVIRAILRRETRVLPDPGARLTDHLRRASPALLERATGLIYRRMKRGGSGND